MRWLLGARFVAAALIGAPANAQAVMTDWSIEDMRSVYKDLNIEVTDEDVTSDGERYLEGKNKDGMSFVVYARECGSATPQRCAGAQISASFTIKPDMLDDALDEVDYAAVQDFVSEDDEITLTRYLIFNGGITRENLKTNLTVFLNIADNVWEMLTDDGYFPE